MRTIRDLRQLFDWQPPQLIARNLRVKLLAMLLALASWVVVVYASNPPDSRQILVHVQQDAQLLPGRYVLAHPIADISVRINGTREHIDAFQTSSIRATPNFDAIGTKTGLQQLPLTVVNTDPNVDLSDAPTAVTADVDVEGSTTVPVIVHPSKTQVGYNIKSLTAEPASVRLTGPERELRYAQAVVDFNFGTRVSDLTQDGVQVVVLDTRSGNRPLTDVTTNVGTVRVTVVIVAVDSSQVSVVSPQLTGLVAPGHELTGAQVDPPLVTLTGPENVISGFQQIPTTQISIAGLTTDHVFSITLNAPQGLLFKLATGQSAASIPVNVHVLVATLPTAEITPTASTPSPSATARSSSPTACPSPTSTPLVGGPTPRPCP